MPTSELTDTSLNIANTTTINGIENTLSSSASSVPTSSAVTAAINGSVNRLGMNDDAGNTLIDITDANAVTKTCIGYAHNCSNLPSGVSSTYGYLITLCSNSDYIRQIYSPYNSSYEYVRVKSAGTWYSWRCIDLELNTQIGNYNLSGGEYPSSSIKSVLNGVFNNTTDYRAFYGGDSAAEEFAYYGFRHNSSKGGIVIIMSKAWGVMVGMGSGQPSTWTYRYLMLF